MNPELREAVTNWMNACFVKEKVRKCPVCSCKMRKKFFALITFSYAYEPLCYFCFIWAESFYKLWKKLLKSQGFRQADRQKERKVENDS